MYIYVCLCNKSNRDDNDLVVNRTFGLSDFVFSALFYYFAIITSFTSI